MTSSGGKVHGVLTLLTDVNSDLMSIDLFQYYCRAGFGPYVLIPFVIQACYPVPCKQEDFAVSQEVHSTVLLLLLTTSLLYTKAAFTQVRKCSRWT